MRCDYSVLAKMSEKLDFGAKSVERAHNLKKIYISEPFNFRHIAHIGLDTARSDIIERDHLFRNQLEQRSRHSLPNVNIEENYINENVYAPNVSKTRNLGNAEPPKPPRQFLAGQQTITQTCSQSKMNCENPEHASITINKSITTRNNMILEERHDNYQVSNNKCRQLEFIAEECADSKRVERKVFPQRSKSVDGAETNNEYLSDTKKQFCGTNSNLTLRRKGGLKKIPDKLDKKNISLPFNFKHVAHVGLDDIFFDDAVIKDETIAKILEEAGVTRKQLDDPGTRTFIIDFLKKNRKSLIEEQEKIQKFERLKMGVSASCRISTSAVTQNNEERSSFTRHSSLNENHFTRTTGSRRIPPPKPPRSSLQKTQSLKITLQK